MKHICHNPGAKLIITMRKAAASESFTAKVYPFRWGAFRGGTASTSPAPICVCSVEGFTQLHFSRSVQEVFLFDATKAEYEFHSRARIGCFQLSSSIIRNPV